MLRRSQHLHLERQRRACENTGTTAEAELRINRRLQPLAAPYLCHLYCIEPAAFDAVLAAITVIKLDVSQVSALLPGQADRKSGLGQRDGVLTAVMATIAGRPEIVHR